MIILNTIIILPLVRYRVMEYYETWAYMTRNVVLIKIVFIISGEGYLQLETRYGRNGLRTTTFPVWFCSGF